jgi:hypothetical protein
MVAHDKSATRTFLILRERMRPSRSGWACMNERAFSRLSLRRGRALLMFEGYVVSICHSRRKFSNFAKTKSQDENRIGRTFPST